MQAPRVLIVDDDENIRDTFSAFLNQEGYTVIEASDYRAALQYLAEGPFDLVFTDIFLDSHSGIDILKEIKTQGHTCPVIMITGVPDVDTAAAALRLGAFDYLPKPVKKEALIRVSRQALRHKGLFDDMQRVALQKERLRLHLEAVFHSVEEGIVTVDNAQRITQANQACERICGVQRHEVTGKPVAHLANACSHKCCHVLEQALAEKSAIREYRIECAHPGRADQVVVLDISPLKDTNGQQLGAVMIIRDVTRLSILEKALQDRHQFHSMIGRSKVMQEIYSLLDNLREVDTTVLITGASGTGKELAAKAIHYNGSRAAHPFVVVNCSALAENLLESELFGHIKGAFTGAVKNKIGRFQMADQGSIFLDEIGDISPNVQLKLLRFLENKEFERVGESQPVKIDAQVITATNQNLKEKVARGEFRADLYYRLKVVEIKLPALCERRDDIPLLVTHYLQVFNERFNRHIAGVSPAVEKIFMEYRWPGNIRELVHTLEHAFVVCRETIIQIDHLPPELRDALSTVKASPPTPQAARQALIAAIQKAGGNKSKAARLLGWSRQTLYRKLQAFGIPNA